MVESSLKSSTRSETALCAVVVLNWKNAEDTVRCCRSVVASDYGNIFLVVCDNNSPDGSYERLQQEFASLFDPVRTRAKEFGYVASRSGNGVELLLLRNDENLGYAGGNNVGIRKALDAGASYVLILNNDTELDRRTVRLMVDKVAGPRIGMVGACVYDYDKRSTILALGGGRFYPWTGNVKRVGEGETLDSIRELADSTVDYVAGACVLVRRDLIDDIGLMREDFFLYFEEIEWALRARSAGWEFSIAKEAMVYHRDIKSGGSRQANANYYFTRNGMRVISKYFPRSLPTAFLTACARVFLLLAKGRNADADAVIAGLRGFISGERGRRGSSNHV